MEITNHRNGPTISLCMIVKDEEKFLPVCLNSVHGHVDEIIIVDTGSTDNTVEMASQFNAKIYHHAWENSFSKARNYSLQYATCNWILILDADEELDKHDSHKLREVIKDDNVNVLYLPVHDKSFDGPVRSVSNSVRVFKNNLGFHYEGIVHNKLICSELSKNIDIKIYHRGYSLDEEMMQRKFIRTSTLLKEQINKGPENPLPRHYLSISYLDRKMHKECIQEALEAMRLFELQKSNAQVITLTNYTASVAFYRMQDLTNAEKYALKALDLHSEYLDAYCILSTIYFLRGEYDNCIEMTKKYLQILETIVNNPSTALYVPFNTLHHAKLAYTRLSIIYFERGEKSNGNAAIKNAVKHADQKWGPYLLIGKYFMEKRNIELAEMVLKDGLENYPDNKDLLYCTADMCKKSNAPDHD